MNITTSPLSPNLVPDGYRTPLKGEHFIDGSGLILLADSDDYDLAPDRLCLKKVDRADQIIGLIQSIIVEAKALNVDALKTWGKGSHSSSYAYQLSMLQRLLAQAKALQ